MEALGAVVVGITQTVITEALCVVCVTAILAGLIVLALLVEACDSTPERGSERPRGAKNEKRPLLLF